MYRLTKEFRFEAAHRLVKGHKGKARHVHGHTWIVRIGLEGPRLSEEDILNEMASLKSFTDWIDQKLDFATLVCKEDESFVNFLKENDQKAFVMTSNPTAERVAATLLSQLRLLGFENAKSVEIRGTCTGDASFSG